ncbi:MAG: hypothetical protein IPG24_20455 [Leptospiraceae bacterium]|nr:hypothetical protein [Leptospiraceae bacterium]
MKLPNSLQPTLIAIGILILFNCASLERDYNDRVDYYQNRNYYNQSYPYSQYPYDSGYRNYGYGGYGQPMSGAVVNPHFNVPKFHSFGPSHHHGGFGGFGHGHHGGGFGHGHHGGRR